MARRWLVRLTALGMVVAITASHRSSAQVVPLSVAGPGAPAGAVLNALTDKVQVLIGHAAEAGSLVGSKIARDLELLIGNTRQQLHDELDLQWDRLDAQKLSMLREVDSLVVKAQEGTKELGRIQDQIALDVEATLTRLPFSTYVPSIRRVEGATHYFRPEGVYRVVIKANFIQGGAAVPKVTVGGKPVDDQWIVPQPPNALALNLPASFINGHFANLNLREVPVVLTARVANRDWWFQYWRTAERDAQFSFKLELFPKYPITYRLTEFYHEKVVDQTRTEVVRGPDHSVPGCGNSGCNLYYRFCVDVPEGEPIKPVNFRDSFSGWGGWYDPKIEARPQHSSVCATYHQHSHNQTRNVGFDVEFYPLKPTVRTRDLRLRALTLTSPSASASTTPAVLQADCPPVVVATRAALNSIGGMPMAAAASAVFTPMCRAAGNASAVASAANPKGEFAVLGTTYSADLSPQAVSHELVARAFTGEEWVSTPGGTGQGLLVTAMEDKTNFKRFTVRFKEPW